VNGFRRAFAQALAERLEADVAQLEEAIVRPPDHKLGVFAFPCFSLAKAWRKGPPQIAAELAEGIRSPEGTRVVAAGGYLNLQLLPGVLARQAVLFAWAQWPGVSVTESGKGRTVLVDYSSPNAGKELVYHHIRSTVIGAALCRIHEAAKTGTKAWLYDEDKWPSGYAGGEVPERSERFRSRALILG